MRQFNIESKDVEKSLSAINTVAAKYASEASDLITAVRITGGVFASASKGVAEGNDALNQFIALMTSVRATTRESAESIATGLRTIFTRIQRPSTIRFLRNVGIELQDTEGKFVGAFEAVQRLGKGLASLDTRDLRFAQVAEELGGFRQLGKVIPLIQQTAVSQEAYAVATASSNSLTRDAITAQQALSVQIAKVREEFFSLIRTVADTTSFRIMVKAITDLAIGLAQLGKALAPIIPALSILGAVKGGSALLRFGGGAIGALKGTKKFASGGLVPGQGNQDNVLTALMPGEFVLRKDAVKAIGINQVDKLNKFAGGTSAASFKNSVLD